MKELRDNLLAFLQGLLVGFLIVCCFVGIIEMVNLFIT